jgi:hypothetical protein
VGLGAGPRAVGAVAAYVIVAAALRTVGPYSRVEALAGRLRLPEERPGISPAGVSIFLGRIGEDGRALYTQALLLDFALPALLAFAAWAAAKWAGTQPSHVPTVGSMLVRVTILAVSAEAIENVLLLIAATRHPLPPLLGSLIGVVVSAKFALIAMAGVALFALAVVPFRR